MARTKSKKSQHDSPTAGRVAQPTTPWRDKAIWLPSALVMAGMTFIVFGLTPFTHNLDDIKRTFYLFFGPLLALVSLALIYFGWAPGPPKPVGWGLLAYGLVLVVSTLASDFSWAGLLHLKFFWGSVGFFLGGVAVGSTLRTSRIFLYFLGLMLLAVNLIGFLHFDFNDTGTTGVARLYSALYGSTAAGPPTNPLQAVLYTFITDASDKLLSTILNRDFYAAFCLLYFPFSICLALASPRRAWELLGVVTTLTALISIFFAKSKGEYIFSVVAVAFMTALYLSAIRRIHIDNRVLAAWAGGLVVLIGAFLLVNSPTIMNQLKGIAHSVTSREIIFSGAFGIFRAFPILGGGPGTFKIYFPQYRSADYFEHEISNVTMFAHNYFLDILSETGLLGFLAYAFFALAIAVGAFRSLYRTQDLFLRLMFIACLTGLLGMYGSNMTSPNARWPIGAVGLWTILGLTAGLTLQAKGWKPEDLRSNATRGNVLSQGWGRKKIFRYGLLALALMAAPLWLLCIHEGVSYFSGVKAYTVGRQRFEKIRDRVMKTLRDENANQRERRQLTQQLDRAGRELRTAIKRYPWHLSSYYYLGTIENFLASLDKEKELEHLEKTNEAYEKLASLAPDYAEIHYNFGVVNYRFSLYFRELLKQGKGLTQERRTALEETVEFHKEMARQEYENMGAMSRKSEVILNLGDTYFDGGDYELAQKTYALGLELYPEEYVFAQRYYRCARLLEDHRGKVIALRAIWRLFPAQSEYLYQALEIASEHGFEDLFLDLVNMALKRNPINTKVFEEWAFFALDHSGPEHFLQIVKAYMKLGGENRDLFRHGALHAENEGREELLTAFSQRLRSLGADVNNTSQTLELMPN